MESRLVSIIQSAEPGERVTVRFAEQGKTTKADADGRWIVRLDPLRLDCAAQVDQRGTGFNRIVSGTVDIGAFEYVAPDTEVALDVRVEDRLSLRPTVGGRWAENDIDGLWSGHDRTCFRGGFRWAMAIPAQPPGCGRLGGYRSDYGR